MRLLTRRSFVSTLALAGAVSPLACTPPGRASRRLTRLGIQLYALRDDAQKDVERTLGEIARIGYKDVEMLDSMNNFGMAPAQLRAILDREGLRAPSTHVSGEAFDDLDRRIEAAEVLGHEYLVLAGLPASDNTTLDGYRRWADRLNEAGHRTSASGLRIAFHDEPVDFAPIADEIPYDVIAQRTDAATVRLQLDTGNIVMGGGDPLDYLKRYGARYFLFHIKDAPSRGAANDTELGKGVVDFKQLLAGIDQIDGKWLYVEQETYPGTPLDSARRNFAYLSTLEF
jgi:sugar phosphate isomerase/epimerase